MPKSQQWYQREWVIILLLVLFAPVGIFLTWKYTPWQQRTKIIASVLSGLFFVIALANYQAPPPTLQINETEDGRIETRDAQYRLTGQVENVGGGTVTANGVQAQVNGEEFSVILTLEEGDNQVIVQATKGDQTAEVSLVIHRETKAEAARRKAAEAKADAEAEAAAAKANAEAEAAAKAEAEKAAAEEAARNAPKTTFGDGTFLVNKDIQPGTYRTAGGDTCYYERRSDASGSFDGIIANDLAQGQAVVEIASSDVAFKSQGCGTWSKI